MDKIYRGVQIFRTRIFPQQSAFFKDLASGQKPLALFITCSDSRIDPDLITQTEPGELFVLRNAGNIVPPYNTLGGGEAATIEYAVDVLKIPHIIVCGHSLCGAMQALFSRQQCANLPSVAQWLGQAEAARRAVLAKAGVNNGDVVTPGPEMLESFIEQNVLLQMVHLRTHPSVAAALARGELELHAWVYVFEEGEVLAYDAHADKFLPLAAPTAPVADEEVRLTWLKSESNDGGKGR